MKYNSSSGHGESIDALGPLEPYVTKQSTPMPTKAGKWTRSTRYTQSQRKKKERTSPILVSDAWANPILCNAGEKATFGQGKSLRGTQPGGKLTMQGRTLEYAGPTKTGVLGC